VKIIMRNGIIEEKEEEEIEEVRIPIINLSY
jgi:hypothetical protein